MQKETLNARFKEWEETRLDIVEMEMLVRVVAEQYGHMLTSLKNALPLDSDQLNKVEASTRRLRRNMSEHLAGIDRLMQSLQSSLRELKLELQKILYEEKC